MSGTDGRPRDESTCTRARQQGSTADKGRISNRCWETQVSILNKKKAYLTFLKNKVQDGQNIQIQKETEVNIYQISGRQKSINLEVKLTEIKCKENDHDIRPHKIIELLDEETQMLSQSLETSSLTDEERQNNKDNTYDLYIHLQNGSLEWERPPQCCKNVATRVLARIRQQAPRRP